MAAVVLATLTLGLTGCSKDNEDLIIGTWSIYAVSETVSNATNPDMNGTTEEPMMQGMSWSMTFNKDHTGVSVMEINIFGINDKEEDAFAYIIDGDKLTVVVNTEDGPETTVATIDKLDKTELWITVSGHDSDYDNDGNGNPYEYDYTSTMKMKKV